MIQVGEYVRTKHKGIKKIARIDKKKTVRKYMIETGHDHSWTEYEYLATYDITMHSFKPLDLIEEGDFVNGMQVYEFDDEDGNLYLGFPIYDDACMDCIEEVRPLSTVEIKSIVTKEQFAEAEYKEE